MEKYHKNILKKSRQKIVDDLDVNDIMDVLLETEIVNEVDREKILNQTHRKDRARKLLDILPYKGPTAYPVFLKSLGQDYSWLADILENGDRDARNNTQEINDQITEVLMRGGVPHHLNLIQRSDKMKNIKGALKELQCGRFLVLHGMPGSGKSVLAAESVRDPSLAIQQFHGGIFWVKIGTVQPDQLLGRIRALCTKLDAPTLPNDIEEGQEILRKLFLEKYSDSLLILDDVWKADVVKTFNLPVRLLVTTQDRSVMDVVPGQYSVIEIQPGFTEPESLSLFASYLKVPVDHLPCEAREIHNESKGSPMVISMVAGLLSESGRSQQTQRQSGRWTYYLNNLRNRRYSRLKKQRSYEHESVMGAVQMSIDVLSENYREMYEQLAVFLDDDPVPSAALEVLWDVEKYEVEDIMNTFIQKSLAMSEYDSHQDCFTYSLHDLQLDYLKNKLSDAQERDMHRGFVDKYFARVHGWRFEDMPHDNYILTHLGYHMGKGEMYEQFHQVYLNLRYVEKVLKNCGAAALLYDYRKYGDLISSGPGGTDLHDDYLDFQEFCRTCGVLVGSSPCTDIVQLGLGEVSSSAVYTAAHRLATQEQEHFYLEWKNRSSINSQNIATILHSGKPTDIKFFPDDRVVTVSEEGVIKIWDINNGDVIQRLHGHTGGIRCISIEPGEGSDGREINLCTGSEQGMVKLWQSAPLHHEDHVDHDRAYRRRSVRRPSPNLPLPTEIFGTKRNIDDSLNTVRISAEAENSGDNDVLAIAWRPGHNQIAAATRSGAIVVLEIGREVYRITGHREVVNDLAYSESGQELASCSDDCTVRLWKASSGEFLGSINHHGMRVIGLCWLGALRRLASVSMEQLGIWENPGQGATVNPLTRNRPPSWNCVAATNQFIAAGTSTDKMVILWSAATAQVVAALPGHNNDLIKLAFSQEGFYLASVSLETMIIWSVDDMDKEDLQLSLGPIHHTQWINGQAKTAAPDDRNRLTVLCDGVTKYTSPPQSNQITALQLNKGCDLVVFGTYDGAVKVFNTVTGAVSMLGRHLTMVASLAVTSNSIVVSGGLDKTVRIFYADRPSVVCKGHTELVRDVRIICEETRVLSCDSSGCLRIWCIETGKEVKEILAGRTPHTTCVDHWEGVGECLAAVGGVTGGVNVIDLEMGVQKTNIARSAPEVRIVRFGPLGRLLVTGHDSGQAQDDVFDDRYGFDGSSGYIVKLQVWDVSTGQPLTSPLELHSTWVTDLAISKDCATLLTAGDRLIWWNLKSCLQLGTSSVNRRRKLSLPVPRSRKGSESKSNRNSECYEVLSNPSLSCSPLNTPPSTRHHPFSTGSSTPPTHRNYPHSSGHTSPYLNPYTKSFPASPLSPTGVRRRIAKVGREDKKEHLQSFNIKGSAVNKVFVNEDFSQFVTVDDAGILYILEEFIPQVPLIR